MKLEKLTGIVSARVATAFKVGLKTQKGKYTRDLKMKEESKNPVPHSLKPFCFKPGQSGNPSGRPAKPKPLTLTRAYEKQLEKIDPETGESYASAIAANVVCLAIRGDIRSVMTVLSNDSQKQIRRVIDELVKNEGCTKKEAALALSLFAPEASL
jgi:uncharacterized protein DUF5681